MSQPENYPRKKHHDSLWLVPNFLRMDLELNLSPWKDIKLADEGDLKFLAAK